MAEVSASGSMSSGAVKEVQQSISKIASDMAKIEKSAQQFAKHMRSASKSSMGAGAGGGGWGGGGGGGGSFTTQSVNAGGYGPGMGVQGGDITDTGTMNRGGPSVFRRAMGVLGQTGLSMAAGAIGDLRPSADEAANYEWASRRARFSTGDYTRFSKNVAAATNGINVMNKEIMYGDVAEALHMGMGSSMGIGTTPAKGEIAASMAMGSLHTIGAIGGMDASTVMSGAQGIYSAQAYYKALAGGVQTRAANGRQLSPEEIANQYAKRYNGNPEELALAFEYGGMGMYELESTFGAEGAELIKGLIMERSRMGKDLSPDTLSADVGAGGTGAAGSKYSQALDSRSRLHKSQLGVLDEYQFDVTNGVRTGNDAIATLNDGLIDLDGAARTAAGALATLGGMADAFGTSMPSATGAGMSGISDFAGSFLGSRAGAGGAGRMGTYTASRAMGAGRLLSAGAAVTRAAGPLAAAVPIIESGTNIFAALSGSNKGEDLDKGDWWQRVGQRTLEGAGAGGLVGLGFGGIGAIPGAIGGGILGLIGGIVEATVRETHDTDSRTQGSGRAKGDWFVEADQDSRIHQGEMVLPSRIAQSVRDELDKNKRTKGSGNGTTVNITLNIQNASDHEAMRFAGRVKKILDDDNQLVAAGEGVLR